MVMTPNEEEFPEPMVSEASGAHDAMIKEIIELERGYFFEKRNVKTERQRKLREIIERHTQAGSGEHDP